MRTRSEEKRREIVRVAAKAFEELGYERTSMLTIAERLSGSKQTLYNYFPSKEDLLRAVLDFDVGEVADQAMQEFLAEKNLRKALIRLGVAYLNGQLAPSAMSNIRIVSTQPAESNLGEEFYENVLRPAWDARRGHVQGSHERGEAQEVGPLDRGDALEGPGPARPLRAAAARRDEGAGSAGNRGGREKRPTLSSRYTARTIRPERGRYRS